MALPPRSDRPNRTGLPAALPRPQPTRTGQRRAVVVTPGPLGDEVTRTWLRMCVEHCERRGYGVAAFADVAGAVRMVATGDADVIVAGREDHLMPAVEIVAAVPTVGGTGQWARPRIIRSGWRD